MTASSPLVDRVRAELAPASAVREVRMFGGLSFMVNDKVAIAARTNGLLVRIDPRRHDELTARPDAQTAEMGPGRSMGPGWIHIPAHAITTAADLRFWIEMALEHNAAHSNAQ